MKESIASPVVRAHDYVLLYSAPDGKELEVHFPVSSRTEAIACTKQALGMNENLTTWSFRIAGGKKLMLRGKQIYPPQQGYHRGGGK